MESEAIGTTLRDYLRVVFRQKMVFLTTVLVVTITVLVGLKFQTRVYEAKAKILVSAEKQVESPYYKDIVAGSRSSEITFTQSEIVKSTPVIERTVRALELYNIPFDYEARYASPWKRSLVLFRAQAQMKRLKTMSPQAQKSFLFQSEVINLKRNVEVEPIRDTNTFWIKVRDFDPMGAAIIANTLSRSYLIYDLEQQLAEIQLKYGEKHSAVIQLRDNIAQLTKTLHGRPVDTLDALGTASSKVVEQAGIPMQPVGKSKFVTFFLAIFASVFLGLVLAFVFDGMDQSFRLPQDIASYLELPCLGFVPKKEKEWGCSGHGFVDQIYLSMKDKRLKVLMVAGIERDEESANVAMHLARELPERFGKKVLLVDANLRKSPLKSMLKIEDRAGLGEVLDGSVSFEEAVSEIESGFHVLSAGKTTLNPLSLLDSNAMASFLNLVRETYDMIFINISPLTLGKDSVILSAFMDAVVAVVTEGKTRRQVARAALQPLKDKGVDLLGIVLNERTFVIPKFIYERV